MLAYWSSEILPDTCPVYFVSDVICLEKPVFALLCFCLFAFHLVNLAITTARSIHTSANKEEICTLRCILL